MSVYKIVGNYYGDMFNFLKNEDIENKGLKNMFLSIQPDKMKQIITKITEMMVKFDVAFRSEYLYWESIKKEQKLYYAINVIMVIVIIIILGFFAAKDIKAHGTCDLKIKAQRLLVYIIIMEVVFTILLLIILNILSTIELCNGQQKLLNDDYMTYSSHLFKGSPKDSNIMFKLFTALGYSQKGNMKQKIKYDINIKNLIKELESYKIEPFSTIVKLINPDNDNTTSEAQSIEVFVYNQLKTDIELSLIGFYDDGRGLDKIKLLIVKASPILMLKEARRIMDFYYLISYKPSSSPELDKDKKTIADKEIIKRVVIKPLNELLEVRGNDAEETRTAIYENEKDEIFKTSIDNIITVYMLFIITCFSIEKYKDVDMTNLTNVNLFKSAVYNTAPDILGSRLLFSNKAIKQDVTERFKSLCDNITDQFITVKNISKTINVRDMVQEACILIRPLFSNLYYDIFIKIKGTIWFPLKKDYMFKKITNAIVNIPFLTDGYKRMILSEIDQNIVSDIRSKFNIISIKQNALIDVMSQKLAPLNVNILQYQNFIIKEMIINDKSTQDHIDDVIELLNSVQRTISVIQQTENVNSLSKEYVFKSQQQFNLFIDDMTYNELMRYMEVDHFKTIVNEFYMTMSEAVNTRTANMKNIYYSKQNNLKSYQKGLVLTIVAVILVCLWIILNSINEKPRIQLKTNDSQTPCSDADAKHNLVVRNTNFWIKMILPCFLMFFITAMLISLYLKTKYSFEFNVEIVETNTYDLKKHLEDLRSIMIYIGKKLDAPQKDMKISIIKELINDQQRSDMLIQFKSIVDKFEKCNYILESSKGELPFPYTEVIMNGFMLLVCFGVIIFAMTKYSPISKIKEIRSLNSQKEKLQIMTDQELEDIKISINGQVVCHSEEMSGYVLGIKIIVYVFIILFLMVYSVKIISTANDFRFGLYNSIYFEQSICYT